MLDTFRVAARLGTSSLAAYVISMSQAASDVLAVELLQKEARMMVSMDQQAGRLAVGQYQLQQLLYSGAAVQQKTPA